MQDELQPTTDEPSELWERMLTGQDAGLRRGRRFWSMLPHDPRCKLCLAPFAGAGGFVARLSKRGRGSKNPDVCQYCEHFAAIHPGGATVEMAMVFADVRHSTELSQELGSAGFAELMRRFYEGAKEEMAERAGLVDKLVGDAVNGFFLPGFTDKRYVDEAIESAEAVLRRASRIQSGGRPLEVGAGVHSGEAYMGSVGVAGDFADFTALGEAVNLASRLSGAARGGELLVSDAALARAERPPGIKERRVVELKGFEEPIEVNVVVPA